MTRACQKCRELIGGYVLDALEPGEREAVHRHLATCEQCAREHAELAAVPALLEAADSADAVALRPPPRLEEAVLDRFAREGRGETPPRHPARRRRARWVVPALAVAACALVALVLAFALTDSEDGGGSGGDSASGQARVYRVGMVGTGPARQASGQARLYPGDTGTGVHLKVSGLRPDAYDYELWCVRDDGWKISAGTFRVDASGRADVQLTTAAKPTEYDGLTVQARPRGGAPDRRGLRVLIGRIKS